MRIKIHNIAMGCVTGEGKKPRQDGRLLPDHVLQPQVVLRKPKDRQRRHHRESTELSYLRRAEHADKHI